MKPPQPIIDPYRFQARCLNTSFHSHIMKHLDRYNILNDSQHNFSKHISMESQLISTVHEKTAALNTGEQHDSILLDFSKAFVKVSHRLLLQKIGFYGIRNGVLQWIEDFLTDREPVIFSWCQRSLPADVSSGVPKGSVIGLVLIILYIKDTPYTI